MREDNGKTQTLRKTLGQFATGVSVMTALSRDGRPVGITVNSFTSLSMSPAQILWCLDASSPNVDAFDVDRAFCVNFLRHDQANLAYHFAQRSDDKFANVPHTYSERGIALLEGTIGSIQCISSQTIRSGDHWIIIGNVEGFSARPGDPAIFYQGKMHELADSGWSAVA